MVIFSREIYNCFRASNGLTDFVNISVLHIMKLFYFSDSTFIDMKTKFENSFKDDFEKKFQFIEKINTDRSKPGSGTDIWKYKTQMIVDAIKQNFGNIIIISDIDIQFFRPVLPTIEICMTDNEICFQKETSHHGINIGFMSIYCNENTLRFWNNVNDLVCNTDRWDQEIVNTLIYEEKYNIKWKLFPSTIWNWSQSNMQNDIILHHANCASSLIEKMDQMKYVCLHLSSPN